MLRAKARNKLFYILLSIVLICGTALPVYASEGNGGEELAQGVVSEQGDTDANVQEDALSESSEDESLSSSEGNEPGNLEGLQSNALSFEMQEAVSEDEALEASLVTDEETLLAAIAAREPVIELAGSFDITGTIVIDAGYEVTITSDSAGPHTLQRAFSTGALFRVNGSSQLILQQVVLDGQDISSTGSLVEVVGQSTLTLNDGAVLQNNNSKLDGGGISVEDSSVLVLNSGCRVDNNTTTGLGGGVYIGKDTAKLYMHGGTINQNESTKGGGGVAFASKSEGYISGGEISQNVASRGFGGGLIIGGSVEFSGGSISKNQAYSGGGVFNSVKFTMTGGNISGNYLTSSDGNGGGIWAELAANTEI